jgi:tRNA A37 threonylcarbamoyladenosine dehydratase
MDKQSNTYLLAGYGALALCSTAALYYYSIYKSKTSETFVGHSQKAAPISSTRKDEEFLLTEQLSRNRQFFGEGGSSAIESSYVVVVGVGGVGSHAAFMLGKAGISRLRLIDFDNVSLSSLNRHACALREDVGTPKVKCLEKYLQNIIPSCQVEAIQEMFSEKEARRLLLEPFEGDSGTLGEEIPTFVIDCIDDLATKSQLLHFCNEHYIPVISSMGAGGKIDPTKLCIGDLHDVRFDPLAISLRLQLRKLGYKRREDGSFNIPCIFSTEDTRVGLLPLEASASSTAMSEDGNGSHNIKDEFGVMPNFRIRIIPVVGTMPALFGQCLAAYTLSLISSSVTEQAKIRLDMNPNVVSRFPVNSVLKFNSQLQQWNKVHYSSDMTHLYDKLRRIREEKYAQTSSHSMTEQNSLLQLPTSYSMSISPSLEELEYAIAHVWKFRSPISGHRMTSKTSSMHDFILIRWRPWDPSTLTNLVLVTDDEANRLTESCMKLLHVGIDDENLKSLDERHLQEMKRELGEPVFVNIVRRLEWVSSQGWL